MNCRQFALVAIVFAIACSGNDDSMMAMDASDNLGIVPLEAPDPADGFQLSVETEAPAGGEVWKCLILDRLPIEGLSADIQWAEARQTPGMHHADLAALALVNVDLEPGLYDCEDLYDMHGQTLMDDAIIVFASQLAEETINLPQGVVAQLPTKSAYMYEVHYVNTSDKPKKVQTYLNAYYIKESIVDTIWGDATRDLQISVPAMTQEHVEWTRCEMNKDMDLLFLSSHTHELARRFEVRFWDGNAVDSEILYENDDWETPALQSFDPPLRVKAGQGFEFRCIYGSTRESETNWGFSAMDEMCQIGYVFTPGDPTITCEIVDSSDGLHNGAM